MKLIIRPFILLLFISLIVTKSQAQYYFYNEDYYDSPILFEVGVSAGAINAITDMGGHKGLGQSFLKDVNIGKTQMNFGAYLGAIYKNQVGLRLEYMNGNVQGADSVLKKDAGSPSDPRYDRNLSFKTTISEFSLVAEIYPTYIFRRFDAETTPPKASPYLMIGVGYFHFNPQAKYKGQWVDLQPLRTEGEGFKEYPDRPIYSLNQINIPLGLGVKYELNAKVNIRAEFLYRKLNTDYLDDLSKSYIDPKYFQEYLSGVQLEEALALSYRGYEIGKDHDHNPGAPRGNPKNKDSYFTFNIKAGFILGRKRIN